MEYSLQAILAQPALLSGVPDETLRDWIVLYPHVPLFRLEQYKRTRNYDDALQTSFRIHNRDILYQLMYGREEAKEQAVPETPVIIPEDESGGIAMPEVAVSPETEALPESDIPFIATEETLLPGETKTEPMPEPESIPESVITAMPGEETVSITLPEEPLSPETAALPKVDEPYIETRETSLPEEALVAAIPNIPEPEQPLIPAARSIADDVLESIRRLKLEREGKLVEETSISEPVVPEALAAVVEAPEPAVPEAEFAAVNGPEPIAEIPLIQTPEPEPASLIPVPDIDFAEAPEEQAQQIALLEPRSAEPEAENNPEVSQVEPAGLYIPDVEEDVIELHPEPEIISDKVGLVVEAEPKATVATEPEQADAGIYIPPVEVKEQSRTLPDEPQPEQLSPPVPDNAPHTFLEWIRLIDGGVSVEKPFDNQPAEEWIEIPRYEIEFQQEHKNVYKVEDFEGELDQQEDLDEDLNRVAGESVEFKQDMMTETLAKIFVKQGKTDKALIIYNTLRLKFPEKSAYFAALIQNLEKGE